MKSSNRVNLINKFGSFLAIAGFSSVLMFPATVGAKPATKPAAQPRSTTPAKPSAATPTKPSSTVSAATAISCQAASSAPSSVPSTPQPMPGETLPATPGGSVTPSSPGSPAPGYPATPEAPGGSVTPGAGTKGTVDKQVQPGTMQVPAQPPASGEMPGASQPTSQPTSVDNLDKPTAMPAAAPTTAKKDNLIARAESKGSFKTLMAALKAADLTETLACKGPYTVFAPTDDAFAALPKGTLEKLLRPENKAILVKLLTYHVVSGEVLSKALKAGSQVTVEGNSLTVKLNGKQVMINNAKVVQSDVTASNGVIHAIDKVIVPPDLQ